MMGIIGPTGSGKNNYLNLMLLSLILAGTHSIHCFFPNEPAAVPLIAEAYALLGDALIPRLIVERLRETDRVIMRTVVQQSQAATHYARRLADDLNLNWFFDVLAHGRPDFKNPTSRPVLTRFSTLAFRARQYSREWWPDSWIPLVVRSMHAVQRMAIGACTADEVRTELEWISRFSMRDQLSLLEPIVNLLTPFVRNAVIEPRLSRPARFSKLEAINRGLIHIIIGDGAPLDAQRLYFALDLEETMNACRAGARLPVVYVADELNRLGITDGLIHHMATMRTFNVQICSLLQYFDFETPAQQEGFCQNSDRVWTPQASARMADLAVLDMRGMLDRFRVHHEDVETRQLTRIELAERETIAISKGPHGETKTKSTTIVPVSIPQIVEYRKPIYESPRDQEFWKTGDLMAAPIGTVFIKPRLQPPRVERVRLFPNSWGYQESMEARYEECLAKVMQNPIFEEPVINPFPVPAATTTNSAGRGRRRRSR